MVAAARPEVDIVHLAVADAMTTVLSLLTFLNFPKSFWCHLRCLSLVTRTATWTTTTMMMMMMMTHSHLTRIGSDPDPQ